MVSSPDRQSQRSYSSQHRRRPLSAATKERSNANKTNALMIRHGPGGSGQRGRGAFSTVRITGACPPSRIRSTPGIPWFSGAGSAPATSSPGCELTSTPPIVTRTELIVTSRETNPDCKNPWRPGQRKAAHPPGIKRNRTRHRVLSSAKRVHPGQEMKKHQRAMKQR
jgi:hypothetical protein